MKKKSNKKAKILRPHRLVFLIVLVAANTFAWFIYANKIDSSVSVHVKGWNVTFEANDNQVTNDLSIQVDDLYPGMEDYEYNISAYNNSEVNASLSYFIIEARVLDTTYVTVEGRGSRGEAVQQDDLTSAQLQSKLASDYPFAITMSTTGSLLGMNNGSQDFTLNAEWDYENNQDALDTQWGIDASDYKASYPSSPCISIVVKLTITQNAS